MLHRRTSSSAAFSVLEHTIGLFALLTFLFGATDISTIVQARTALAAATKSAVRCVYTTDGLCTDRDPKDAAALFDVYHADSVLKGWSYHYSGVASWLELPIYSTAGVKAEVLKEVTFDVETRPLALTRRVYPAQGRIDYIANIEGLPFIQAQEGRIFDVEFFRDRSSTVPAEPQLVRELSSVILHADQNASKDMAEISFMLRSPLNEADATLRCYDAKYSTVNFSVPCADPAGWTPAALGQETYIVLDIQGDAHEGIGNGAIALQILQEGGEWRNLGGRKLSGSSVGHDDFVPRGGAPEDYSWSRFESKKVFDPLRTTYGQEILTHQAIKIPYGRQIKLRFTLLHESGDSVAWRGKMLTIYAPRYERRSEWRDCSMFLPPGEAAKKIGCDLGIKDLPPSEIRLVSGQVREETLSLGCVAKSPIALERLLAERGIVEQGYQLSEDPLTHNECRQSVQLSSPCPMNFGVSEPTSNEALEICPPPIDPGVQPTNVRWSFETITPQYKISEWTSRCNTSSPLLTSLPAELQRYRRIIFPAAQRVGSEALNTTPLSPTEYKRLHEDLNCDEVKIAQQEFNSTTHNLPVTSLFRGRHADLGPEYADRLREEALRLGMNPSTYFEGVRDARQEIVLPAVPERYGVPYWFESGKKRLKIADAVSEEESETLCKQYPQECVREFVGFQNDGERSQTDFALAEKWGMKEMRSLFPRAREECQGSYCAEIHVEADGDYRQATAELDLPLRLFFGNSIKLKSESRRLSEVARSGHSVPTPDSER